MNVEVRRSIYRRPYKEDAAESRIVFTSGVLCRVLRRRYNTYSMSLRNILSDSVPREKWRAMVLPRSR